MDEPKAKVCPLCKGTGYCEERVIIIKGEKTIKKVSCENCEGTGAYPYVHRSPFFMMHLFGKKPIIK